SSPRKFDTFRLAMRDRQRTRGVGVAISADGGMIAIAAPPLTDSEGKILFGTGAVRVFTNGFMRGTKFAVPTRPDGVNGLAIPTRAPKLKFSPDGAYLVALLSYGCGVRVWDTRNWSLVGFDDDQFNGDVNETPECGTERKAAQKDRLSHMG